MKTWKKRPQTLLIIGPNFFFQYCQLAQKQPKSQFLVSRNIFCTNGTNPPFEIWIPSISWHEIDRHTFCYSAFLLIHQARKKFPIFALQAQFLSCETMHCKYLRRTEGIVWPSPPGTFHILIGKFSDFTKELWNKNLISIKGNSEIGKKVITGRLGPWRQTS